MWFLLINVYIFAFLKEYHCALRFYSYLCIDKMFTQITMYYGAIRYKYYSRLYYFTTYFR